MNREERKIRRRRAGRSVVADSFGRFNRRVYRFVRDGAVGHFLSGYDRAEERFQNSYFVRMYRYFKKKILHSESAPPKREKLPEDFENLGFYEEESLPRSFTDRFAQSFDSSRIIGFFGAVKERILYTPIVTYGVLVFSFALFLLLTQSLTLLFSMYSIPFRFLTHLASVDKVLTLAFMAAAVVLMAASLVLIFAKEVSFYAFMMESRLTGLALRRFMGLRSTAVKKEVLPRHSGKAFILGMIFGLVTFFVPPAQVFLFAGVLTVFFLILNLPEFGLLLTIFLLPFFSFWEHSAAAALAFGGTVLFGTLIKLLRGKRHLKIELIDLAAAGFLLLVLFGGIVTLGGASSFRMAAVYLLFGMLYFAVTVLVKSIEWLERCLYALMASSLIVSCLGILEWALGKARTVWQDNEVFDAIAGRVVSLWENPNVLAEFLLVTFFVSLGCLIGLKKASGKMLALFSFALSGACLLLTWSRGAWLGAALLFVLMLLVLSPKTFPFVLLLAAGAAMSFVFLPDSFVERVSSILTFSDSSVLYRLNIWRGCSALIRRCFLTGVGVGEEAFTSAYRDFALTGIEAAPHSHSLYMQIVIELGIVGLLLFFILIVLLLRSAFSLFRARSLKPESSVLVLALTAAVMALLVNGLTDYIWYNSRIFLLFWVVVGLISAGRRIGMRESGLLMREPDACDLDFTLSGKKRRKEREKGRR